MKLSDRVAALEGADREVDMEILLSQVGHLVWKIQTDCPDFPDEVSRGRIQEVEGFGWMWAKPYTASLDAAVTLFDTLPDTIPSCPRQCAALALRMKGL